MLRARKLHKNGGQPLSANVVYRLPNRVIGVSIQEHFEEPNADQSRWRGALAIENPYGPFDVDQEAAAQRLQAVQATVFASEPSCHMTRVWTRYPARCRNCGQSGLLHVWSDDKRWGFVAQGIIGVAVNRHNPVNSVVRCNACQSPVVEITREATPGRPSQ